MPAIYDDKGSTIADMTLSEKQIAVLATGADITVLYHTPQLLRGVLGSRNGSFVLRKVDERIITDHPQAVKDYASLQKAIVAVRGNS